MRVCVIGPTGQCGRCVVDELLSRNHSVVGVSRSPPSVWDKPGDFSSISISIFDEESLSEVLSSGFDAVVCAFAPPINDLSKTYELGTEGHGKIKKALLKSTHKGPFIIIGGGGSLHLQNGRQHVDAPDFAYSYWYKWPIKHFEYMSERMRDHGNFGFSFFVRTFAWARENIENPGRLSWVVRPLAKLFMSYAKKILTSKNTCSLITCSRMALTMWEGVQEKPWSFLSPPWLLRDKGIRTGKYEVVVDDPKNPATVAIDHGIYNEDMAVAIVDEVETNQRNHLHWTCVGPIDLGKW